MSKHCWLPDCYIERPHNHISSTDAFADADTNPATAYELGRKDGPDAERERIVQIIEDVKTDHWPRESGRGDGYDLDTCDEITRRIIKEQQE